VVSAVCAGVGGSMLAIVSRLASPSTVTLVLSISLLTAIVVGGLGSLLGAVIGSGMLVFLATAISDQGRASGLSDATSAAVTPLVYGVVLVLVMISAPRGLTGTISTAVASRRERRRTQQDAGPHDPLPDPRAASQKEST
jgi:branched-chain amino acid transport system permease protein